MTLKFGLQPWNQAFTWEEYLQIANDAERLGYEQLWTWEHVLAAMGAPDQPTFDAYTLLAGWSQHTTHATLGVLVGANTFWHPALLAKKVTTLDHLSSGRAILGLGAGWFELEHTTFGIPFGSGWGERLAWLDQSARILRALLDGKSVTGDPHDRFLLRNAYLNPRPVQTRLPLLIGGAGEQKTLRTVARYADIWNWVGLRDVDAMRRKHEIFEQRCEEVGRDPSEIEKSVFFSPVVRDTEREALTFFQTQMEENVLSRSVLDDDDIYVTTPEHMTELMLAWKSLGVTSFIVETAAPYDAETIHRMATDIRPRVEAG